MKPAAWISCAEKPDVNATALAVRHTGHPANHKNYIIEWYLEYAKRRIVMSEWPSLVRASDS